MPAEYVHERSLLLLTGAALKLGLPADFPTTPSKRRSFGACFAVPVEEYRAVACSILSHPGDTLGIELARALPLEKAGVWGAMLRASETFGAMLGRAQRHMRLFFRYTRLSIEDRGDETAIVCLHPDPSPIGRREQVICLTLGRFLVWGRGLASGDIVPVRATMKWDGPRDKTELEEFFGCSIRFGAAEDAMVFRRETMALALSSQTPELTDVLEKVVAESIRQLTGELALTERVRDAIADGLPAAAREEFVAGALGMTVRTLRRRLAQHNVSFRELLAACRRERAESLLLDGRLSITEVSYALGYAEPANFYRAFRSWTGLSPAKWRSGSSAERGKKAVFRAPVTEISPSLNAGRFAGGDPP